VLCGVTNWNVNIKDKFVSVRATKAYEGGGGVHKYRVAQSQPTHFVTYHDKEFQSGPHHRV
jgi:hypothetical protein